MLEAHDGHAGAGDPPTGRWVGFVPPHGGVTDATPATSRMELVGPDDISPILIPSSAARGIGEA